MNPETKRSPPNLYHFHLSSWLVSSRNKMTMEEVINLLKTRPGKIWTVQEVMEKLDYPSKRARANLNRAALQFKYIKKVPLDGRKSGYKYEETE